MLTLEITERGIEIHDQFGFVAECAREDEAQQIVDIVNAASSLTPNSYLLDYDEARDEEISAVATLFKDKKPVRWAVRCGNSCMGKTDGVFIYEPRPSSRDDEYFAEYRFATIQEAHLAYLSFYPLL
jgi:hypothetical protein